MDQSEHLPWSQAAPLIEVEGTFVDMTNSEKGVAVVQQPNSNTNPTDKHRVIYVSDWWNTVDNGAALCVQSTHDNYADAQKAADALNGASLPPQVD